LPVRPGAVLVDADLIAARRWPGDPESHAYEASRIATSTRAKLIERRQPLIAETVFSHPSKLDLIQDAAAAGYFTALHVVMVPEDLAVARVAARVAAGGHTVPENKIRERHRRLWPLVAAAIALADVTTVYDNSQRAGPGEVALFAHGFPLNDPAWPGWTSDVLTARWPQSGPG
jgi:predicted ABC-type ATPase